MGTGLNAGGVLRPPVALSASGDVDTAAQGAIPPHNPSAAAWWFDASCQDTYHEEYASDPLKAARERLRIVFINSFGRMRSLNFVDEIACELDSDHPCVVGVSLWALGEIGPEAVTVARGLSPAYDLPLLLRDMVADRSQDERVRLEARRSLAKLSP